MDNISRNSFSDIQAPIDKIYSAQAIYGGTFLGGPLAAGYFIGHNFSAFGEPEKVKTTWIVCIISTIGIFSIAFLLPPKFPAFVIPLLYSFAARALVQNYQGNQIAEHLKNGGTTFGFWKTATVVLACLVITLVLLFLIVYLLYLGGFNFDK